MHTPRNIQSPYTSTDFWTQYASVNPRFCLCVKVTSKAEFGSTVVGFTTNSRNMTLPGHGGVTFYASPSVTPTIIEQGLDEAAQLEMTGVYTSTGFTQQAVMAGQWNYATAEVFGVCWDNVNLGELLHFKGNLGEIKDYQTYFTAEGRGLIGKLSQEVDWATSRLCRVHEFRDSQCGHSASTVTISGTSYNITQTSIRTNADWTTSTTLLTVRTSDFSGNIPPENFYRNGKITFTSGANSGLSREIAYSSAASGGNITLQLKRAFPYDISGGTRAYCTLVAGCDRTIEDCMKYSNIVNRRAEDYVPTIEAANRLPTIS